MRDSRSLPGTLLIVLLLLGLPCREALAETASPPEVPVAEEMATATRLTWQPRVEHEGATLTVSGRLGPVSRVTFAADDLIAYDLVDAAGADLPDGSYFYELRFTPRVSPQVRRLLKTSRETGDDSLVRRLRQTGRLPESGLLLSGHFAIRDGALVASGGIASGREPSPGSFAGLSDSDSPLEDQVISDNLIVAGGLCAGVDCVSGEDFYFNTIRLKENNTRIRFVDTSSISSFPRNHWQITANDSNDGGRSHLSIEDLTGGTTPFTVMAGARSRAVYLDSSGRVGFGTSTPEQELHLVWGDTPALRLHQDTSMGWPEQAWDIAANETDFVLRDVTNGLTVPFRLRTGAPANSFHLAKTGDLGLGTSHPAASVHVERADGSARVLIREGLQTPEIRHLLELETAGSPRILFRNNDPVTDPNAPVLEEWEAGMSGKAGFTISRMATNGAEFLLNASGRLRIGPGQRTVFDLRPNGNLTLEGALKQRSSRQSKENFTRPDPEWVLERLRGLPVEMWNYRESPKEDRHLGPTAEAFHDAFGLGDDPEHLSPMDAAGVALAAIQAMERILDRKDAQVAELAARVDSLERELEAVRTGAMPLDVP